MGTKEGEDKGKEPNPNFATCRVAHGLVDTRSNSGMISNGRSTHAIEAYSLFFFCTGQCWKQGKKSGKREALRGVCACESVLSFCCQLVMIMQRMKRGRRPSKQDRRIDSKETRETRIGMG